MANRGTPEGTEQEIAFVKLLNKKEDMSYWRILDLNPENHFAIRVITKQYGEVSGRRVFPKADAYIARGNVLQDYLEAKDFYLDEEDVTSFNLEPIEFTGISIKLITSKKFQIAKMSPNVFKEKFGNYELGAGVNIYSDNEANFYLNPSVIERWKITEEDFFEFFNIKNINSTSELDRETADKIKKYSIEKITKFINENKDVSDFIFKGVGNFKEPYTAHYLYKDGELKNDCYIPFNVTNGSGRSTGGSLSVEFKPK